MTERCEFGNEVFCESPEVVESQISQDPAIKELPYTGADGSLQLVAIGLVCIIIGINMIERARKWLSR